VPLSLRPSSCRGLRGAMTARMSLTAVTSRSPDRGPCLWKKDKVTPDQLLLQEGRFPLHELLENMHHSLLEDIATAINRATKSANATTLRNDGWLEVRPFYRTSSSSESSRSIIRWVWKAGAGGLSPSPASRRCSASACWVLGRRPTTLDANQT
jgi:hypothetical protein